MKYATCSECGATTPVAFSSRPVGLAPVSAYRCAEHGLLSPKPPRPDIQWPYAAT